MRETRVMGHLRRLFPQAHFQRIETWTGGGIFDTNACLDGVEAWIEMKQVNQPKTKRALIRATVRRTQIVWEMERRRAGGRTFIAFMYKGDLYLLQGQFLKGLHAGVTQDWLESEKISDPQKIFLKD